MCECVGVGIIAGVGGCMCVCVCVGVGCVHTKECVDKRCHNCVRIQLKIRNFHANIIK